MFALELYNIIIHYLKIIKLQKDSKRHKNIFRFFVLWLVKIPLIDKPQNHLECSKKFLFFFRINVFFHPEYHNPLTNYHIIPKSYIFANNKPLAGRCAATKNKNSEAKVMHDNT